MILEKNHVTPEVLVIALLVLTGHPELDRDRGAGAGETVSREQFVWASVRLQSALTPEMREML